MVKLAVPHFDEEKFSATRFEEQVDFYLKELGAERLDVVQWLVRQTPNTYERQAAVLAECRDELAGVWPRLRAKGKVGALAAFPYSPAYAADVLDVPAVDGLAAYLNPAELDFLPFLERDKGFIAIRPLFAGLLTPKGLESKEEDEERERLRRHLRRTLAELGIQSKEIVAFSIRFALLHERATSTVVSVSSREHAAEVIEAAASVHPDRATFRELAAALQPDAGPGVAS